MRNLLAVLCGIVFLPLLAQTPSNFQEVLNLLENQPESAKTAVIEAFIESQTRHPILEDNKVIFLAKGYTSQSPHLLADFNGFLHPRYVADSTLGQMHSIPGTSWYYFQKELLPDSRVLYQFNRGDTTYNDPLNRQIGTRFGQPYSEITMPGYQVIAELIADKAIPVGHVEKQLFPSIIMDHERTIHIYTPPGYETATDSLPTIYLHDGSDYLDLGRVRQILDYLIHNKKIKPLIAVFDDPVIRGKEYRRDEDYKNYIDRELIPHIHRNYRTLSDKQFRGVIGGSRGGLSALSIAHSLDKFGKCGVFSPAIFPSDLQEFIEFLNNSQTPPTQVYMLGAIYDHIWYPDALRLKKYFENSGVDFTYMEISEGHNIEAWRTQLDEMLTRFFPF